MNQPGFTIGRSASKCAFDITEQFALQQLLWDRRTVNSNKGLVPPPTYYAGVRQGVQDAAKDSSVLVQLIETNAQGDISKESTFVDTLVARNVDAIILSDGAL